MIKGALALGLAAILLAGCGEGDSGSTVYTAEEFIDAANAQDAGLVLGAPLEFPRPDADVRDIRFEGAASEAAPGTPDTAGPPVDVHGAGTIAVFEGDDGAIAEFERCRAAGFACFRIANVAVVLTGTTNPADLERLEQGLVALEGD